MYPKNDFRDYSDNSFMHYGVKGMKWGERLPVPPWKDTSEDPIAHLWNKQRAIRKKQWKEALSKKARGIMIEGNTGASEAIKNAKKQSQYLTTQADKRRVEIMKQKAIASGGTKVSGNTAASEAQKQGERQAKYLIKSAKQRASAKKKATKMDALRQAIGGVIRSGGAINKADNSISSTAESFAESWRKRQK